MRARHSTARLPGAAPRRVGKEPIGVGLHGLPAHAQRLEHRLETPREHVGVGNSPIRILFQELVENVFQFFGNILNVLADRLRLLEALFVQHFGQRLAAKHRPAGEQGVHQRPEAVEIGPRIHRPPFGLLRRHIFDGAQDAARAGQLRVAEQTSDAEVGEFDVALGGHQEVAGLNVAMDHPTVVCVAERAADFDGDPCHLAPIEMPAMPQFLFQAVPLDQFHRVEQMPFLFAKPKQPHDVGMIELAERFDFGLETIPKTLLLGQVGREEFDGGRLAVSWWIALYTVPMPPRPRVPMIS